MFFFPPLFRCRCCFNTKKNHGRCILCLVILGFFLLFFCLEGDGASQALQKERGSRGHSPWKGRGLQHPEEEEPNSALLSEHSGWQGNILEFSFIFSAAEECPSQSLLTSSACSLDSLALQHVRGAGQARLRPGDSSSQRRRCLTKPEIPVSFTARDFQLDSHVTSLVTRGTKLVMKQPPPYCHLVDKKEESDPAFQLPEETSGFGSSQGPGNKIGVYSVPVDGFQHLGWPACLSRNQASAGLLPAGPQQQA